MANLYGTMTDKKFNKLAVTSIVEYWNNDAFLALEYGNITTDDVYTTWQCKAIENFKGLFGVDRDGDGLYFEFTYHHAESQCYLDIYKKMSQVVVPVD